MFKTRLAVHCYFCKARYFLYFLQEEERKVPFTSTKAVSSKPSKSDEREVHISDDQEDVVNGMNKTSFNLIDESEEEETDKENEKYLIPIPYASEREVVKKQENVIVIYGESDSDDTKRDQWRRKQKNLVKKMEKKAKRAFLNGEKHLLSSCIVLRYCNHAVTFSSFFFH